MFLRGLFSILVVAVMLWPTALHAQVSQTATYTLSVTIPESAKAPAVMGPQGNLTEQNISAVSPQVNIQSTTRDRQAVLLASYVVD